MSDEKLFNEAHRLEQAMLVVRDRLKPIVDGDITRGHCPAGTTEACGGTPGKRKLKLKDAREIARHAIAYIDRAVNRFLDNT